MCGWSAALVFLSGFLFIVCEFDLGLSYAFGFSLVFGVLFIAALKVLLSWIFRQIRRLSCALSFVTLFFIS